MIIDSAKANSTKLNISSTKPRNIATSAKVSILSTILCSTLLSACQNAPVSQPSTAPSVSTVITQPTQPKQAEQQPMVVPDHTYPQSTESVNTDSNYDETVIITHDSAAQPIDDTVYPSDSVQDEEIWIEQEPVDVDSVSQDESTAEQTPVPTTPSTSSGTSAAVIIIKPPKADPEETRRILLERARQNSQSNRTSSPAILNNGDNLPAFRQLMDIGISQLKANQLNAAESTFTRAQRMAPQSSAVYFYLGQVALKKNQPRKAEATARRGLVVAQSAERRRALWQIILLAGQKQNNPRVVQEAQNALK